MKLLELFLGPNPNFVTKAEWSRFGSLFICSDMHTSHLHPGAASGFKINSCGSYLRRKQRSEVRYRGFFGFLNHIFCRSLSAFTTSVQQKHRWSALIMDKLSIYWTHTPLQADPRGLFTTVTFVLKRSQDKCKSSVCRRELHGRNLRWMNFVKWE